MNGVLERLDRLERDVRRIDLELSDLRELVTEAEAPPAPQPQPVPVRVVVQPAKPPAPFPSPAEPMRVQEPSFWSREALLPRLEAADLLGARGLALAGGVVTLLGVVFFFALAASNGWIGPMERVLLGAAASTIVFAAGVVAYARHGRLHAAVTAVGVGIAGGYATLLFAAARYELIQPLVALGIAAGIAAIAVALSLRWSSEIVAAFGLIGAMCVPAVALLDGGATAIGTSFVALVFLGAAVVGTSRLWDGLLVFAGAVSVPQLIVLVLEEGDPAQARVLVVAGAFGLLYLGTGVARQLRADGPRLDAIAGAYAGGNVALTLFSSFVLLSGDARGVAVAAASVIYGAVAATGWRREPELAALTSAAASALAAVALAQFLDGPALVVAWAAETAALAWLGRRVADSRFQLLALAYLGLALGYTLVVEAEPDLLFERAADHVAGVPALLAVAAGAAAYGLLARSWPPPRGLDAMPTFVRELVEDLHAQRPVLSQGSIALAAILVADAASLALLELFEWLNVEPAFDWGHVAVTGLWSLVALALLTAGLVRTSRLLEIAGLITLGSTIVSFALFTVPELQHVSGWSALVLAGACAVAALLHGLLGGRPTVVSAAAVALGAVLSSFASFQLLSADLEGYGLLAAAAAHLVVAAGVWRRRDLATCFWTAGVVLGLGSALLLLEGTWFVLSLTAAAAVLAVLGRRLPEPRFWIASASLTGLAGVFTLTELAEPSDFVSASNLPAAGVPALALVGGALAALLLSLRRTDPVDELDERIDEAVEPFRHALLWLLAGLALYGASLSILGLVEAVSTAGETTEFQRGHTAVSAFWGVVAFVALVIGLRRGLRVLRLAALGLFALALGKLFLYDLSTLSSVTRAGSFLAVGAVLLLAGFVYQRFSSETATS
jgi:uncharacterized membrane protein